ncbi:hypothetical protein [Paenibacillus sp. URB8-2]|uniref:hypothetical protein n=1 Tax=Paenibacillus sp. URB8-2 TaxID=2741301 RepID=UPI0015BF18CC|nr:hypothetical protein [Paenibacillus sp. URB8-2]BCG60796.1 hypothetical protein PUR_42210 [Paenibacillus sp. URB8-2]
MNIRTLCEIIGNQVNNIKTYTSFLNKEQIMILKSYIGRTVQIINSQERKPDTNRLILVHTIILAFKLNQTFFKIIKNEWLETEHYNYYWKLTIERSTKPEGINYDSNRKCYFGPHYSFNLPRSLKVNKIEIYDRAETIGEEIIRFDYGIIFYLEEQITMAFFPMKSIADGIKMNLDKDSIEDAISECSLRQVIM